MTSERREERERGRRRERGRGRRGGPTGGVHSTHHYTVVTSCRYTLSHCVTIALHMQKRSTD